MLSPYVAQASRVSLWVLENQRASPASRPQSCFSRSSSSLLSFLILRDLQSAHQALSSGLYW